MIRVERIEASQWQLLKVLRCQALADAPYAFSTTLEEAERRPDAEWISSAARMATDVKSTTFIAYCDEACGMMSCYLTGAENQVANLVSVWVAPEVRRLKVAHHLLDMTQQWARKNGARVLHAWVAEKNTAALRFYETTGFQYTDQREPFKSDASQEIILLSKHLS